MPADPSHLTSLVQPSLGRSEHWRSAFETTVARLRLDLDLCWRQTDVDHLGEGLYVKIEDDERVVGRYKWVRSSFTQTILDAGTHHLARPMVPNALHPSADMYATSACVDWSVMGLRTLDGLDELKAHAQAMAPGGAARRRRRLGRAASAHTVETNALDVQRS